MELFKSKLLRSKNVKSFGIELIERTHVLNGSKEFLVDVDAFELGDLSKTFAVLIDAERYFETFKDRRSNKQVFKSSTQVIDDMYRID